MIRTPRTLPRILGPEQVDALLAALRTHRDRAMAQAMVLGRLRRCEVLGLQLADLRVGQRRVFIANGKGGHQRLIPVSSQFFGSVAAYMETERPAETNTKAVFVAAANNQTGRQQLFQHLLDRLEQTPC
ncbi:MAG: tyrosine-type recombinase/integrase [Pseudonocardiaceae bacterium]